MADLMAGLGFLLLGFILFQVSDLLVRYPADNHAPPPWRYLAMKGSAYLFFGVGAILLILGFL